MKLSGPLSQQVLVLVVQEFSWTNGAGTYLQRDALHLATGTEQSPGRQLPFPDASLSWPGLQALRRQLLQQLSLLQPQVQHHLFPLRLNLQGTALPPQLPNFGKISVKHCAV